MISRLHSKVFTLNAQEAPMEEKCPFEWKVRKNSTAEPALVGHLRNHSSSEQTVIIVTWIGSFLICSQENGQIQRTNSGHPVV